MEARWADVLPMSFSAAASVYVAGRPAACAVGVTTGRSYCGASGSPEKQQHQCGVEAHRIKGSDDWQTTGHRLSAVLYCASEAVSAKAGACNGVCTDEASCDNGSACYGVYRYSQG